MLGADGLGGLEAFVRVGGWHPDVDDRDVRSVLADRSEQGLGVADLGDDIEAGLGQQPRDALPQEERVVGQDEAEGHAPFNSARMAAPVSSSFGMNPRLSLRSRRGP